MYVANVEFAFLILVAGALVAGTMRSWRPAGWVAAGFVAVATILAWIDGLSVLLGREPLYDFILPLPGFGSELAVALDPLGAGFLLLITGVSLICTIYSIGYMTSYTQERPRRFYSLLLLFIAGMVGVVCVADWLFFIVFWELMTLVSYFLVTFERESPEAVRAGFKYFIMTHIATVGLLVATVVLWRSTGSFSFDEHKSALAMKSVSLRSFLLALYLLAFSTKAGILPMGDWLPDAHPAAPAGISAILSGVMIKLGAYGTIRVFWEMLTAIAPRTELVAWGIIIATMGTLTALIGGLTAMKQNDAKRLLAFSSISQMGYIYLALGIGITFAKWPTFSTIALIGILGAGFHILNDTVYKSLLFMNAGSVVYSTGSRDLNKVGGLASIMPVAAAAGLLGAASLSGLPPLNGFVSKWLIYQACISGGIHFAPFVVAVVLVFFASLATLAYSLKYCCTALLGKPAALKEKPVPIPRTMSLPQAVLAIVCVAIGLGPVWAVGPIMGIFGYSVGDAFAVSPTGGLYTIGVGGAMPASWSPVGLFVALLICFVVAEVIRRSGGVSVRKVPSWYGGEEHPDDEVRFRAQGFYSPFNTVFEKIYPSLPLPRLPSLAKIRSILDFDSWLYTPFLRLGGVFVDTVSRSHTGVPQVYMVWQVAGMIVVLALLVWLVR